MNKKNKAARAVNAALGLIVILAVIVMSPLFGYARGFASPEQRMAAAEAESQTEVRLTLPTTAATPRPTPEPTPTPVVLPSAPPISQPTAAPTPKPVYTPAPQQNAAPAQAAWTPTPAEDWNVSWEEDEEESWEEETAGNEWSGMDWSDTGGTITTDENGNQYIPNNNFDLIFADQTEANTAQTVTVNESVAETGGDQGFGGDQAPSADSDFQQDAREGKVMTIE